MDWARASAIGWLFNGRRGSSERLIPRWLFLRALGLIYFSAFFSLIFQAGDSSASLEFFPPEAIFKQSRNRLGIGSGCGMHPPCCGFRADRRCSVGFAGWA